MKYIYAIGGLLFFALGTIGTFVPILPTTPFILLSVYCFSRSSERLHKWLKSKTIYQKYVAEFIETHTMTKQAKVKILILSSTALIISFWRLPYLWARILILLLTVYMFYYFHTKIKTK